MKALPRIFASAKRAVRAATGFPPHTWHLEALFVATVLVAVAFVSGKGAVEWIGVGAVFFTWMHASVANRLEEAEAARAAARTKVEVECFRWATRYFYMKEVLWFAYFLLLGAWSALAGTVLFLCYGPWRRAWRAYQGTT